MEKPDLFSLGHLLTTIQKVQIFKDNDFKIKLPKYRTLTRFWPPPTPFLAPLNQGRLLVYGRNGQSICLLSPFFCPSSKIAQPKYAKGASERARSASVYGTHCPISNLGLYQAIVCNYCSLGHFFSENRL